MRAWLIIREIWSKQSPSVGLRPILVLSYKNHAIDEFLVDLVNAEPRGMRNQLIRIGGQCKDTRLAQFSERNVYDSDQEVRVAKATVDDLLALKISIQDILEGSLSNFLAYHHQVQFESDPQEQRKAVIDATRTMMESIARKSLLETALPSTENTMPPKTLVDSFRFLTLTKDKKPSTSVTRLMNANGSTFVPRLLEGVEHYKKNEHWGDLMFSWLCGTVPLPQCRCSRSESYFL